MMLAFGIILGFVAGVLYKGKFTIVHRHEEKVNNTAAVLPTEVTVATTEAKEGYNQSYGDPDVMNYFDNQYKGV